MGHVEHNAGTADDHHDFGQTVEQGTGPGTQGQEQQARRESKPKASEQTLLAEYPEYDL